MFNTIRYMGSKRKLIEELNTIFDKLDTSTLVDLFTGSGVVALNYDIENIQAVDIQAYSSAIIQGSKYEFKKTVLDKLIAGFKEYKDNGFIQVNYSGKFFSKEQASFLDYIRTVAKEETDKSLYIYIGIKMMFLMQNSPGHFAAFLSGTDRSNKLLSIDPIECLENIYEKWEYKKHNIITNTGNALDFIETKNATYYMDPPYTTDQYSRFYHLLETFTLDDMPKLTDTKALYREDRFKSDFSYKGKAEGAFNNYINKIFQTNSNIVISYFTNGVISVEKIAELVKDVFGNVETKVIEYSHSSLGGKPKKAKEVIIWGVYNENI